VRWAHSEFSKKKEKKTWNWQFVELIQEWAAISFAGQMQFNLLFAWNTS
jgi:hypothetical protein